MLVDRESALDNMVTGRFVPFHYNRDSRTFHFGEQTRRLGEIPPYGMLHQAGSDQNSEDMERLLSRVAFASSARKIQTLTQADVFFEHAWTSDLEAEVQEVMRDVYIEVDRDFPAPNRESSIPSKKSFLVDLYERTLDPNSYAGVFLQTHGICACTRPEDRLHAKFDEERIVGYREHNVETIAERTSLLAGLGHIARRANEYVR